MSAVLAVAGAMRAPRACGAASRVRVEVVVNDSIADATESAIATAAHTGHRGDGKIYVQPLASARRISTGQTGTEAV